MSEFATGASLPNPTDDWTNLDNNIRAEWATQLEGPEQGRLGWTNGMRMFHEDAIPAQMLSAAEYITLWLGLPPVHPRSHREAVDASRAVLSLIDRVSAEPAWALPFAPRLARLALAVIRINGWQSAALGGRNRSSRRSSTRGPMGSARCSVRCPGVADVDLWTNFFRTSAAKPAVDVLSTPSGFRSRAG